MSSTLNLTEECIDLAATWDTSTRTKFNWQWTPETITFSHVLPFQQRHQGALLSVGWRVFSSLPNTTIVLSWLAPLIFFFRENRDVKSIYSAGMLEAAVIGTAQVQKYSVALQSNLPVLGQTYCTIFYLTDTASQIPSLLGVCHAVPAWQAWQLSTKGRLS